MATHITPCRKVLLEKVEKARRELTAVQVSLSEARESLARVDSHLAVKHDKLDAAWHRIVAEDLATRTRAEFDAAAETDYKSALRKGKTPRPTAAGVNKWRRKTKAQRRAAKEAAESTP